MRDCNISCGEQFDHFQINRNRVPGATDCGDDTSCVADAVCASLGFDAGAPNFRQITQGDTYDQAVHDGGGGRCLETCRGGMGANLNPPYFLFTLICCAGN
jgi:hypothetical protein